MIDQKQDEVEEQMGPPMKEDELRQFAECGVCGKKIGQTGLPIFYLITVERHGLDAGAVKRRIGLEGFLGSPRLAAVMGPDEAMTKALMPKRKMMVCEPCSQTATTLMALAEYSLHYGTRV